MPSWKRLLTEDDLVPASSASPVNLLTNGGFEIWQRGVGPFTAQGAWTADQWRIYLEGAATVSVSQITSTIGGKGLSLNVNSSIPSGMVQINQQIGGILLPQLRGRTVTFSAAVKCSGNGNMNLGIWDGVNSVSSPENNGTGEQVLTVTAAISSSATVLQPVINVVGSCTLEVNDATLVIGPNAGAYVPLHPADELARCQRFYEILGASANALYFSSYVTASGVAGQSWSLAAKEATPTITKSGNWTVTNCGQPVIGGSSNSSFSMSATGTAAGMMRFYTGADGKITAEANPF